jgi:DNA damage-binding protein 1
VLQKNLTLVCEKETRGAVYNLNAFCGKLLAGINSLVKLFNWGLSKENKRELVHECSHMGHIIALKVETKDNVIVVGDLMKSITLLEYQREYARIEEIAHDFSSNWMTAVEILDDNTYLGAESSYNLFTVQRNADADTEDKRGTLELCGTYHLGDSVNRFRRGSLVMRMPDQSDDTSSFSEISTWLFGTISGGLGVVATLPKLEFLLLNKVQEAMQKVVTGVGNFSHSDFRCFHNVQRSVKMQNFIDGDLVEIFLDLTKEDQEAVSKLCGVSNSEDLVKKIEEISRLTH